MTLQFMLGKVNPWTAKTFSLLLEGNHTASELIALGKYDWHNDWITDERFPIVRHAPIQRTIEYVTFNRDVETGEVLAGFGSRELDRPTYEDALYFGKKYPNEQRKHRIVWLHEPVLSPDGDRRVLMLYAIDRKRYLLLTWFGQLWDPYCVFPAVRK